MTAPPNLETATALAALAGERDLDVVAAFLTAEGMPALQTMAIEALLRQPDAAIACLTGQEVICAALALLAAIEASECLRRALGPVEPALRGIYGSTDHRAVHARTVLRLLAADSSVRAQRSSPRGAT